MEDKQPTFAERTTRTRDNATALLKISETIETIADALHAEAEQMERAQKRFAERNAKRTPKASR
jgi:hypothetical protein